MKITDIETFLVPPRWLFLKVSTDEEVSGWGEPVVEGRAETVRAAVHEMADLVLGQDPLRIEDHWQVLRRAGFYRGGPVLSSALSGFDHALWDIAGKVRQAPVHELLGERLYSRWDFKPVLDAGVAVVQPDPAHAGGISELRRIAALAEVYGASLAPHCPLGPIALAASLRVAFATPNFLIQEQSNGMHYHDGGVAVRAAAEVGHAWRTPLWRHDDGSLAEW